jgi:hypothetical protein
MIDCVDKNRTIVDPTDAVFVAGITPVVRKHVKQRTSLGEEQSRLAGALIGAGVACFVSHPLGNSLLCSGAAKCAFSNLFLPV